MYTRLLKAPAAKSFFLFGPRGTGKSVWVKQTLSGALYLDLLESDVFADLLASPQRLDRLVPQDHRGWVVLDEVQKVPAVLDEVHRLIEKRRLKFALTGSSARKLRRRGVNLLAGRAITLGMHPLTCAELERDFDLKHSLRFGQLPGAYVEEDPGAFLESYVRTYLLLPKTPRVLLGFASCSWRSSASSTPSSRRPRPVTRRVASVKNRPTTFPQDRRSRGEAIVDAIISSHPRSSHRLSS